MMTSREVVRRAIEFARPDRLPRDLPGDYGSDFAWCGPSPSPDDRPLRGVDEWGAVWDNIGISKLGEVKEFPLKRWEDWAQLKIPDIHAPRRWEALRDARAKAGARFLVGAGISIYERVHFIRGLENTWMDIFDAPDRLRELLRILVAMNLAAIERLADAGADGFIFCDDWGLQNRLMIDPVHWRKFWKPAYAEIYRAAHARGLLTFLHSCGYIVDILDDLIEVGLNVIHMDQQENMGLERLGRRFGGRLTFFSPVDIQTAMHKPLKDVRAYCRKMAQHLGRPEGGFIARWYTDPQGAGHRQAAIDAMSDEFLKISRAMYGQ